MAGSKERGGGRGGGSKPAQVRRAAREARLAAALRDNLRRRKDQVRARSEGRAEPEVPSGGLSKDKESGD